ncbi:unnamed protein product [Adineta ricciae]|uniref:Antistasin-like domain-containing protein n=1 Tax=Adineta ricciae TaxID=249248 RepID=A0A815E5S1_ADIRI|nr:unnamed protein product [Adineta ricciae]CAF1307135.1 unnamed protein product [Adineta ricciae]
MVGRTTCDDRPLCRMYCLFGYRLDAQGCATCKCKSSPCEDGAPFLKDYSCQFDSCPETYYCKVASSNAYAVCCPVTAKINSRRMHSHKLQYHLSVYKKSVA